MKEHVGSDTIYGRNFCVSICADARASKEKQFLRRASFLFVYERLLSSFVATKMTGKEENENVNITAPRYLVIHVYIVQPKRYYAISESFWNVRNVRPARYKFLEIETFYEVEVHLRCCMN